MSKGSWSASETSTEIVGANLHRASILIQIVTGDITALSIDEDAIYGQGVHLISLGDYLLITGTDATKAIYAICDSGNSSTGGYQEGN